MDGILTPEQLQALEAQAAQEQQGLQRQAMQQNLERDAALVAKYSDLARTESRLPWYMPRYDEMGNPNAVPVPSGVRLEYARKASDIQNEINKRVQSTLPKTPQEVDAALSAYLGTPVKKEQNAQTATQPQPTSTPEAPAQPSATTQEQKQPDQFSEFTNFIKQRDQARSRAFDYIKKNYDKEYWLDGLELAQKMTDEYFPAPRNIAQPIIDQFTGKPLEGYALIGGKVEKIEKPKVEEDGRSVIGYEGKAPTQAEAVKFREAVSETNSGVRALDELIQIGRKGSSLSPNDRAKAQNLARMIQGKFRSNIVGPGAVTENDREVLEQVISNPLQIFTLVDIPALLADMKYRVLSDQNDRAAILGLKPTGQSSQPSQGGGGNVLMYNQGTKSFAPAR